MCKIELVFCTVSASVKAKGVLTYVPMHGFSLNFAHIQAMKIH